MRLSCPLLPRRPLAGTLSKRDAVAVAVGFAVSVRTAISDHSSVLDAYADSQCDPHVSASPLLLSGCQVATGANVEAFINNRPPRTTSVSLPGSISS
jgi:hypothetical protein